MHARTHLVSLLAPLAIWTVGCAGESTAGKTNERVGQIAAIAPGSGADATAAQSPDQVAANAATTTADMGTDEGGTRDGAAGSQGATSSTGLASATASASATGTGTGTGTGTTPTPTPAPADLVITATVPTLGSSAGNYAVLLFPATGSQPLTRLFPSSPGSALTFPDLTAGTYRVRVEKLDPTGLTVIAAADATVTLSDTQTAATNASLVAEATIPANTVPSRDPLDFQNGPGDCAVTAEEVAALGQSEVDFLQAEAKAKKLPPLTQAQITAALASVTSASYCTNRFSSFVRLYTETVGPGPTVLSAPDRLAAGAAYALAISDFASAPQMVTVTVTSSLPPSVGSFLNFSIGLNAISSTADAGILTKPAAGPIVFNVPILKDDLAAAAASGYQPGVNSGQLTFGLCVQASIATGSYGNGCVGLAIKLSGAALADFLPAYQKLKP